MKPCFADSEAMASHGHALMNTARLFAMLACHVCQRIVAIAEIRSCHGCCLTSTNFPTAQTSCGMSSSKPLSGTLICSLARGL